MSQIPQRTFVSYRELKSHGVRYTRKYVYKLMRRGQFPLAYKLSDKVVAWDLAEVGAWKDSRPQIVLQGMEAEAWSPPKNIEANGRPMLNRPNRRNPGDDEAAEPPLAAE